jgi:hypothetical protein
MKCIPHMTLAGDFSLEVVAENDFEFHLLSHAWKIQGYERANGSTTTPEGMKTGFYVPLFMAVKATK